MLAKIFRLPASFIPGVMRRGKRTMSESFQLIVQKGVSDVSRFTFIVSTKVDKRATHRNRMKRTLGESVRHLLPRLHGASDCIFIARKEFSGKTQAEVDGVVSDLLKKAGLLE